MYTLVGVKLASIEELKTCYTLDEALNIYSLWRMMQDIEAAKADEIKSTIGKKTGRRR